MTNLDFTHEQVKVYYSFSACLEKKRQFKIKKSQENSDWHA